MRNGRPLRFLATTIAGWTALRVAMLWPSVDSVPALIRAVAPPLAVAAQPAAPPARPAAIMRVVRFARFAGATAPVRFTALPSPRQRGDPARVALALAALVRFGEGVPVETGAVKQDAGSIPPPLRPTPLARGEGRLAGSAWLLARGGTGGTLTGGRLGGSQTGARITWALGDARRIALAARVAAPLSGRGSEAALGVEWRPAGLPVRLVAEQRFSLDGGRGGPTLMAIGGVGPTPVAAGFTLEAYAQAGAVARGGVEGFADGAARLARPVATLGLARLDIGAGAWGAVQRDAGRVDIGPTLGVRMPVAGRSLRLTLDWRERVAGGARPGSGPAVSVGTDF